MIRTARLNLPWQQAEREGKAMEQVLDNALEQTGLTRANIWLDLGEYSTTTHFGNWCLVPVRDNAQCRKLAAHLGTKLDLFRSIIEPYDLTTLHVGQKVRVYFDNDWGMNVNAEGTVHALSNDQITIRAKRSRSKGWTFKPFDFVSIEP